MYSHSKRKTKYNTTTSYFLISYYAINYIGQYVDTDKHYCQVTGFTFINDNLANLFFIYSPNPMLILQWWSIQNL